MTCMTKLKIFFCIVFFLIAVTVYDAHAASETINRQEIAVLYQQLSIEQQQYEISQIKLADLKKIREQQLTGIKVKDVNKQIFSRARLNLEVAQADLTAINQTIKDLQDKLIATKTLSTNLLERQQETRLTTEEISSKNTTIVSLQSEIDYLQTLYNLQNNRLKVLQKTQQIAQEVVKLEQIWVDKLTDLVRQRQNQIREEEIQQLATTAQKESRHWLDTLASLNQQLQLFPAEQRFTNPDAILLSVKIFHAQESVYLSRLNFDVARLQDEIQGLGPTIKPKLPLPEIDKQKTKIHQLKKQADQLNQRIMAKQYLLQQQLKISRQSQEQSVITSHQLQDQLAIYSSLIKEYSRISKILDPLRKKVSEYRSSVQKNLSQAIAQRQGLPGFDLHAWLTLLRNVLQIPEAILGMFVSLRVQIAAAISSMSLSWILFICFVEVLWSISWLASRYLVRLGLTAVDQTGQQTSAYTAYVLFKLLQKNLVSILFFGYLIIFILMSGVPYQSYRILIYLALIWLVYRWLTNIVRYALLESVVHTSGHDVWLYHRLKWVFRFGALITAVALLVNELSAAYDVRDFFNRLFMFVLLVMSIVLFRARKVVPALLQSYTAQSPPYVRRLIVLMSTLFPLTLLSNAITGLVGYVQLAWVMSYYQAIFLLVVAAYIIIRGLLIDLINFISELSIRYLQNGWLWSQAFLKPLDRIVRIFAAVVSLVILFYAYGWGPQSYVVKSITAFLYYPLFHSHTVGTTFTLASIIEFVILIAIVFWAARWTREFSYRWMFSGIKDLGLRNSLGVFSQYTMFALGAIITLRVLGVDISGLSFILGGLAVGLGFGLRDFANNFVSGVMLLIERPIREGDTVTVGQFEGTITHMGIRSSMLKSWDNMEVLIPNSEIFNKVFTNWTLQDNTVRSVIKLNVHRSDDPSKIVQMIHDLLSNIPELLKDPESQVYLDEINDVFIEIEVRYFINIQEHSRAEVRSKVLLAIMDLFKQQNITPPYPQQDIRLLNPVITTTEPRNPE